MLEAPHRSQETLMMREVPRLLEELADLRVQKLERHPRRGDVELDAYVEADPYQFLVECKGSGAAAPVARATMQLRKARRLYETSQGHTIPLLVVPFMGSTGKGICREAGVAWVDLAGNAYISAPGLRVHVEGRPNRFERPTHGFGPRSSRIARELLFDPAKSWTFRELRKRTELSESFVSRTIQRLQDEGLVVVAGDGLVTVPSPDLLLDAWREVYDFSRHRLLRGHVAARSGEELLERLVKAFDAGSFEHAATGLAAAWKLAPFSSFRLVTFYVPGDPGPTLLDSIGFRETDKGANVWLVLPNDKGVLQGSLDCGGVTCVSAVQTYLDLKGHPERAREAAAALRAKHLFWSHDG